MGRSITGNWEFEMPKVIENECVYQAVMQVVLERGYAGATTKQMAEAAGVSEVTLFRKYENKSQLVRQAISWLVGQLGFETAAQYSGDIKADLLHIVQAYQDLVIQHGPFIAVLLSEMPRNPELADFIDAPIRVFTNLGQVLARYQTEGVLRQEHPMHALAALLGPLIYTTMLRGAMKEIPLPPLDLSNHVDYFLDGRRCPTNL
jgi:AcrR family transcriptional regulator